MKPPTTEELVWLYGAYQPKEVIFYFEKCEVKKLPFIPNDGVLRMMEIKKPSGEFGLALTSNCRLILRSPSSLTDQELQELAEIVGCKYVTISDNLIGFNYEIMPNKIDCDWRDLDDQLPLQIARFLFQKQINFLNLDSTIAVTE